MHVSFFWVLKRGALSLMLGASLMGLAGCATVGTTMNEWGYTKLFDSYGDNKLIEKDNDLYLEKLDGSELKKITNTPTTEERDATFSKDGNYIAYSEEVVYGISVIKSKCYIIHADSNDATKKSISFQEFDHMLAQRRGLSN